MITIHNYYSILPDVDRRNLPSELQAAADFVDEVSEKGKDWSAYNEDEFIRRMIDQYFAQLSEITASRNPKNSKSKSGESEIIDNYKKVDKSKPTGRRSKESEGSTEKRTVRGKSLRVIKRPGQPVELISEEIKFIKRYTLLNGKLKNRDQIRLFINALQRAMTEKRIRKTSKYAEEILDIQDSLIKIYHGIKKNETVEISIRTEKLNSLYKLIGRQELMMSVRFIKSYIGLQGKIITQKQATSLYNRISKALDQNTVAQDDPYWKEVTSIHINLKSFVQKNPAGGILDIPQRELNGLQGIVGIGSLHGLNGFDSANQNTIMNSMDFVQMSFDKIGFTGRWLQFIGNPSPGFAALVSAPPKFGKSILCTGWAGDMARQHGRVLYVAKEEGLDDTLQDKLDAVAHPNLDVSNYLPQDLRGYNFVFLDSITRLQLSPEDLNRIRAANPSISFVFVSQVTKAGKARGSNEFAHDVDCIIEFPEIGKAVQYGRFNQGSTMNIFNNHQNQ